MRFKIKKNYRGSMLLEIKQKQQCELYQNSPGSTQTREKRMIMQLTNNHKPRACNSSQEKDC